MQKRYYSPKLFERDCELLVLKIDSRRYSSVFGVPRGGMLLAGFFSQRLSKPLVDDPRQGTLVVDDIVDSGKTRLRYKGFDFACLHVKKNTPAEFYPTFFVSVEEDWVEYFWEKNESPAEDAVTRLIEVIGDDPNRKGLFETPRRVIASFEELFVGYKQDPAEIFKTFDDEQEKFEGLVYLKDIEFYSTCEHHLLPFSGKAMIAYIPNGPVIGASKLARLLDIYSRRLQMQERIAEQVTNALMKYLNPLGAACLIEAKHFCITCRGVRKQHSIMGYNSLKGAFLEGSPEGVAARGELMVLYGRGNG